MSKTSKIDLIQCGGLNIYLLLSDYLIPDEQISRMLHPKELKKIESIGHPKKKEEFKRSRWLIRQFHNENFPLFSQAGESFFKRPKGTALSLSHKESIIGLTLAPTTEFSSIGLDIENLNGVKQDLATKICSQAEINLIKNLLASTSSEGKSFEFKQILSIIFSFKEAVFKACFPIGQIWFYFEDFEVNQINLQDYTISGKLKKTVAPNNIPHCTAEAELKGSFVFKENLNFEFVISTCTLPPFTEK